MWILAESDPKRWAAHALQSDEPEIRVLGIRIARRAGLDTPEFLEPLAEEASAKVRREAVLSLHGRITREAAEVWSRFATRHDGRDRWYLEALGIAAEGNWEHCFAAWQKRVGDQWDSDGGRDIVWRCRSSAACKLLAEIISDPSIGAIEQLRYFRAFDFHDPTAERQAALKQIAITAASAGARGIQ